MKISFVNFATSLCGGNRVLFEVANGLIRKGHDVDFVGLAEQSWFPLKAPLKVCKTPAELGLAVPKSDVVVATWCMSAYLVDALKGTRGVGAYYCQHYEPIFFTRPDEQVAADATYDLPLSLIANSPWLQNQIKEKHNRESSLIVPGVDLKVFKVDAEAARVRLEVDEKRQGMLQSVQKAELNWKDGAPKLKPVEGLEPFKVLAFATAGRFKGFYDTLLPAVRFAARSVPIELHLFGDTGLPVPCEGFGVVKHPNTSDAQLAELYDSCDLYVLGSWAESSPLAPLEAMACGCPVLCTAFGSEHYGGSVERVYPRRPRDLGARLAMLLGNPVRRAEMSKQGLVDVQGFTWKNTVDCAERFFKGLVGEA